MPYGQGDFKANILLLQNSNPLDKQAMNLNAGLHRMGFDLEREKAKIEQRLATIEDRLDLILKLLQGS